jgi:integrase
VRDSNTRPRSRHGDRLVAPLIDNARKGKATPGTYRDGKGLMLKVEESGSARWVLRTTIKGKRRDLGLGSVKDVALAAARERAHEVRKEARAGKDPTAKPKAAMSFADAAAQVHALRKHAWSNGKHVNQWINTIKQYANPKIGRKDVGEIEAADVLNVLAPIWLKRAETARRLRQRIGVVLDWAQVNGYRSRTMVNAAGAVTAALPKQATSKKHHAALPWGDVLKFLKAVRASKSMEGCRLALEFTTLTAARTSEAINATWPEFDLEAALWIVPAERMKANKEHRVPLSGQAVTLLRTARDRWPNARLVFPGRYGKPLSDMAMLMCMRRLKVNATPHGLRSSFRDWCADNGKDDGLAEAALAHTIGSKTERAYKRTDHFEARRALMQAWADFATGKPATNEPASDVRPTEMPARDRKVLHSSIRDRH